MRSFSANVKQLLASDNVSVFYLVKLEHASGTLYDTTAASDIVFNGHTYNANSGLISIEPPRLSDVVDREAYKIVYADAEFSRLGALEGSWTGVKATVYAGFYNTIADGFAGVSKGAPILTEADMVIAYKGIVDTQGYTVDPDNGSVVAVIECASPVASLGLVKSFYSSKESMRLRNRNDSSFDEVHVGSEEAAILWGKA